MKFRNVKTGVVIDAPSMLGGNWERIDGGKSSKKETSAVIPEPEKEVVEPVKKTTRKTTKKTKK